jgi:hypothetical protein
MTTSRVRLFDALGRNVEIVVPHSPLAGEDAIIEMARNQAGVPPHEMRRGEIQ